jgi:hypothetical protein
MIGHRDNSGQELHHTQRARRADAAIALRIGGASYEECAGVCGYGSARAAQTAIEKRLIATASETDRAHQRDLAARRLDRLLSAVWLKATYPDHPEQVVAARAAKDIVDRWIRLFGLDAPTEVVVHSPTSSELDAWVARLVAQRQPEVIEYDILAPRAIQAGDDDGRRAG